MDVRHFSEFVVLSETLNYSKAAQYCCISQPALSNHISALEKELGVLLFHRDRRRVALTPEGEILLTDTRRLLSLYEHMHRFNNRQLADNFIITVGGTLDNPEILGRLASLAYQFSSGKNEAIKLFSDRAPFEEQIEKLRVGELDLFIAFENTFEGDAAKGLSSIPFYHDHYCVALNARNPLASRTSLRLEELKDLKFIRLSNPVFDSGWDQIMKACSVRSFIPKHHSVFINSVFELPFMAIDSDKCFVFSYGGLSKRIAFATREDLKLVPVENETFSSSLFYHENDLHPFIKRFIEYLEHSDGIPFTGGETSGHEAADSLSTF